MAEDAYTLQDWQTLDLAVDGGSPVTPVAGITGVTVIPSVSIEQLYTSDSIKMSEQIQHEFSVDVEIEYARWDQDASVVQQWLGGSGSTATSMTDTSQPQKFQLDFQIDSVGGDRTIDITVTGITFEELPIVELESGEYASRSLSGTAEDITNMSMTDNTA